MRIPRQKIWLCAVVLISISVAAAACESPTADVGESDELERFKSQTADRLDEISAQLEGLDAKDRREKLIELAEKEGAVLTLYGVTGLEEMSESVDAFEEDTGTTVNYFRAGSEEVLARLVEEGKADFRGADAVIENGPEMTFLDQEGLFAAVDTPASDKIPQEGVKDTWFWCYLDIFTPAWNTKLISPAPKTWEEVLTKYNGQLAIEIGDIEWFATLVKDYLMAERGMTEEEAIDLFKEAGRGATFVDGHTLILDLMSAGEFGVTPTAFTFRVDDFKRDGAPIEWEPAVTPLIARSEGIAIHATAEHPAAALLFLEWYLTDGQRIGLEQGRQAASTAVQGGGLPTQYENILVDVDAVIDEFDKWSGLWDEIVQRSGKDVIEE